MSRTRKNRERPTKVTRLNARIEALNGDIDELESKAKLEVDFFRKAENYSRLCKMKEEVRALRKELSKSQTRCKKGAPEPVWQFNNREV